MSFRFYCRRPQPRAYKALDAGHSIVSARGGPGAQCSWAFRTQKDETGQEGEHARNWNEVQRNVEWGSTEPTAGTIAQTLGPAHRTARIGTMETKHPAIGDTRYLPMEPHHVLREAPGPMNSCFTFHLRWGKPVSPVIKFAFQDNL